VSTQLWTAVVDDIGRLGDVNVLIEIDTDGTVIEVAVRPGLSQNERWSPPARPWRAS
jgi:hypothetical protein